MNNAAIVSIAHATVSRHVVGSGKLRPIFTDLSWRVNLHDRWAVVGAVGSGKTSLGELLTGRHHVDPPDAVSFPALEKYIMTGAQPVRLVSFKEDSGLFSYSKHYYQERYHWTDSWNDITLRQYLDASGSTTNTSPSPAYAASTLDLTDLLDRSFLKLSNGQVRRARIARALVAGAKMVVMDEPFMGLDPTNRRDVASILGSLASPSPSRTPSASSHPDRASSTETIMATTPLLHLILLLRPQDPLPHWITHVLVLDRMRVAWQGDRDRYMEEYPGRHADGDGHTDREGRARVGVVAFAGRSGGARTPWAGTIPAPAPTAVASADRAPDTEHVVKLEKVNVSYGGTRILKNVDWTVTKGDRWALVGANGSGKSTLLSLITGDNPQSYSNRISLFGQPRGSGESIWEIKSRLGLVSPEVHFYFHEPIVAERVVAMGLPAGVDKEEGQKRVTKLMEEFGQQAVVGRRWDELSVGEQRLLLIMRSLVSNPELLIWDEPFQGLDPTLVSQINSWIESHLRPDQTLIFVTHSEDELPAVVDRKLRLDEGAVVEVV
ncbi:hypothetical protein HDU93_003551 [Gonapodya sp. JEL0774]|nr:hypothetical protein HDU93_003551 [Gonapodya sp. JEL0774]